MKEVSWNLMVTISYYKAADSVKSNLVFISALLSVALVGNRMTQRSAMGKGTVGWKLHNRVFSGEERRNAEVKKYIIAFVLNFLTAGRGSLCL